MQEGFRDGAIKGPAMREIDVKRLILKERLGWSKVKTLHRKEYIEKCFSHEGPGKCRYLDSDGVVRPCPYLCHTGFCNLDVDKSLHDIKAELMRLEIEDGLLE